MLKKGELSKAFSVYWSDAERCLNAKAYWCLLHVAACLPDVCAALQSRTGKATPEKYQKWCDQYFNQTALTGLERYEIRCKVLHEGRARKSKRGRYAKFAFGQPDASGRFDHVRSEGDTLHIDVGELYRETREAMRKWIIELESNPSSSKANFASQNLTSLIHVTNQSVPVATAGGIQSFTIVNKTS